MELLPPGALWLDDRPWLFPLSATGTKREADAVLEHLARVSLAVEFLPGQHVRERDFFPG